MKQAALLASIVVGLLVAYAVGGTLAAFVAASAVFILAALWLRGRLAARPAAVSNPSDRLAPGPRRYFSDVSRLEAQLFSSFSSRRIYDHSLKPRLFRLALALLSQRRATRAADAQAVHDLVGDELWSIVDPSVKTDADEPRVKADDLREVLVRFEGLL